MDFSLTDEQQATADLARQILTDRATHEKLRELEKSGDVFFDRDTYLELAKAGLLGIAVPEADGGAGLGLMELSGVLQAVGKTGAAVPVWESLAMGALPVAQFGSDDIRAQWLPGVIDGTTILTAAWHEDDRDPHATSTTATKSGDGY